MQTREVCSRHKFKPSPCNKKKIPFDVPEKLEKLPPWHKLQVDDSTAPGHPTRIKVRTQSAGRLREPITPFYYMEQLSPELLEYVPPRQRKQVETLTAPVLQHSNIRNSNWSNWRWLCGRFFSAHRMHLNTLRPHTKYKLRSWRHLQETFKQNSQWFFDLGN